METFNNPAPPFSAARRRRFETPSTLDNRFIFQTVVESVRRVKQHRQLILITHNPNIPVLGDAEQVLVLESDGVRARVSREGNVDACKDEIVTLLEGGAEAFQKRGQRYGHP